jgi:hypothetical protein
MKAFIKNLAVFFCLLALFQAAHAFKLENIDMFSDFHIGLVSGVGTGLDFGVSALFLPGRIKCGLEIEQLITDVDYTATLNALKYGGIVNLVLAENWTLGGHLGVLQFRSNKDIVYNDLAKTRQVISADQLYKGRYWGVSLNYLYPDWGLIITPKYSVITVDEKGSVAEFDINVGKSL